MSFLLGFLLYFSGDFSTSANRNKQKVGVLSDASADSAVREPVFVETDSVGSDLNEFVGSIRRSHKELLTPIELLLFF